MPYCWTYLYSCLVRAEWEGKNKTFIYSPYWGIFASLTAPLLCHQFTRISLRVNICCPFISMRGRGKKGHCFLPLVSVFRMTHRSLQKTNSPNESSCCTRCQLLGSREQPQALCRVSTKRSGEQDTCPIPRSSHHRPQQILLAGEWYVRALRKPCRDWLQPSRGHCTHCCVYTTPRGGRRTLYGFTPRVVLCQGPDKMVFQIWMVFGREERPRGFNEVPQPRAGVSPCRGSWDIPVPRGQHRLRQL